MRKGRTGKERTIASHSTIEKAVVFGASGAIGFAFLKAIAARYPACLVHAVTRSIDGSVSQARQAIQYDPEDERSVANVCRSIADVTPPDLVIIATGILHEDGHSPEKSLRQLEADSLRRLFEINTVLPAMIIKHLAPRMDRRRRYCIAALSARVGSIGDNDIGGWYSYRASKAALNMIIRTASIELARRNPQAVVVGLHPGTVDSALSEPFRSSVPSDKLFTPEFATESLLDVIESLEPADNGGCFDWAGEPVPA